MIQSSHMKKESDLPSGSLVNVEYLAGDLFNHDFIGVVIGHKVNRDGELEMVKVRDQDNDVWDCLPQQVAICNEGR
jgi:hypothetical protein